jgi:TnpA family transposase
MDVQKAYVDSHGQSDVAFAFCHLLGFYLLPRLKRIHAQRLYRPIAGEPDAYPGLQPVLSRPIDWDLIRRQYNEMVKIRDRTSARHRGHPRHPAPFHPRANSAPHIQSFGRAW